MAKLIYSAIASLDGYVEDGQGGFGWAEPDEEVLRYLNELERPVGIHLYGRRMYETLRYWETAPIDESVPDYIRDWTKIWRSADKIVYSRTLNSVSTARTRLERNFVAQEVERLKATVSRDLVVGGPELARQAIEARLVDEYHLYVVPVVVGGGKPWLPHGIRLDLERVDSHLFASGFIFLRYRAVTGGQHEPASAYNVRP
jgi:dihydrofolate reductase